MPQPKKNPKREENETDEGKAVSKEEAEKKMKAGAKEAAGEAKKDKGQDRLQPVDKNKLAENLGAYIDAVNDLEELKDKAKDIKEKQSDALAELKKITGKDRTGAVLKEANNLLKKVDK